MRLWVDEGHGGNDPGTVSGGKSEDTRNLTLGEAIEVIAKVQGWAVESTREKDIFVTLAERYKDANAFHADVFVSIHHDWSKGQQAVIFPSSHDAAASKRLADKINRRIDPVSSAPNGGIYADRRGLAVLKGTNMPAVIIEVTRVQDAYSVNAMAEAIVRGICDYRGVTFRTTAPVVKPTTGGIVTYYLEDGDAPDVAAAEAFIVWAHSRGMAAIRNGVRVRCQGDEFQTRVDVEGYFKAKSFIRPWNRQPVTQKSYQFMGINQKL